MPGICGSAPLPASASRCATDGDDTKTNRLTPATQRQQSVRVLTTFVWKTVRGSHRPYPRAPRSRTPSTAATTAASVNIAKMLGQAVSAATPVMALECRRDHAAVSA